MSHSSCITYYWYSYLTPLKDIMQQPGTALQNAGYFMGSFFREYNKERPR